MASQVLATIYHFVVFTYYCYVYTYYKMEVDKKLPNHGHFGGDSKFLTIWCCLFQIVYFFVCCVTDLIVTSGSRSRVGLSFMALRDWFLCSIAFPIVALVVLMYWGIFAVDPELIYPQSIRGIYPMWLSHCMHTWILPLLIIDMMLVKHNQPKRRTGITSLLVVGLSYLGWLLYLGFVMDIWVYPVLHVLEGMYFVLFVIFTSLVLVTMYYIGEKLNMACGKNKPDADLMYSKID